MAKSEETLAAELADAKEAYRDNLDDDKAKAKLHKAAQAVVEARQARRGGAAATEAVGASAELGAPNVGGDAVISNGNEG